MIEITKEEAYKDIAKIIDVIKLLQQQHEATLKVIADHEDKLNGITKCLETLSD